MIDLADSPKNDGPESRSKWTKIQQTYENVHPNLALQALKWNAGKVLNFSLHSRPPFFKVGRITVGPEIFRS